MVVGAELRTEWLVVAAMAIVFFLSGCSSSKQGRSASAQGELFVRSFEISLRDQCYQVKGSFVAPGFLDTKGSRPYLGRLIQAEDQNLNRRVAVLSYRLWQTVFKADPTIIGTRLSIDSHSYTVIGVMPQSFDVPSGSELWLLAVRDLTAKAIHICADQG